MANYDMPDNLDKRLRYFHGQFLQDQDFVDEQNYHLDRKRRHDRLLHSAGVGEGLTVTLNAATSEATVAPGTAFDSEGRQLVLQSAVTVSLAGFDGQDVNIEISYQQLPSDPSTFTGGEGDTRWHELPLVEPVPEGQVGQGDNPVILGTFNISTEGVISGPNNTARRYAGIRLPENGPSLHTGAPDRADLTGSLHIENNLTVQNNQSTGGNLLVGGSQTVNGNQTVGNHQTVNGTLTVIGTTDLRSNTRVRGNLDVDDSLNLQIGPAINEISTDETLSGNSDTAIPTEQAVKQYIDRLLVGSVSAFAMTAPPVGWLQCNGAAVSRSSFARLFSAIGTRFGSGNGSSTFNLPDLRNIFIRGANGRAVGSFQSDAMEAHYHNFYGSYATISGGGHSHVDNTGGWWTYNLVGGNQLIRRHDAGDRTSYETHSHGYRPQGSISGVISATTSNETRPVNLALLYCIKY